MKIARVLLAGGLSVGLAVVGVAVAAPAAATPGKSPQWTLVLVGTCDGVPATVIYSPGPGPSGFSLLTGKMGVGRLFEAVNIRTGEVVPFGSYGDALEHANQPIVTCDFPIPPNVSPDGTADRLFQVTGFFHSGNVRRSVLQRRPLLKMVVGATLGRQFQTARYRALHLGKCAIPATAELLGLSGH